MLSLFQNAPLLMFFICAIGAVVTWFAADQFREQILGNTHPLVRSIALRYLQIVIGLFAIFLAGTLLASGGVIRQTFSGINLTPMPTLTPTATITPTFDPFSPPTETPAPTANPALPPSTATPFQSPTPDPDLVEAVSAEVVGTSGIGVNMRDNPGLNSNVIAVVPESSRVIIQDDRFEEADGLRWYRVITPDGQEGWITDLFLVFDR